MGDMDINGDLVRFVPIDPAAVGDGAPEPGTKCPTCDRRVNHPRKDTSPTSRPFSYRVPVDEAEAHEEVSQAAAEHLGVYERPHWRYQLNTIAYAAVLQDASLKDVGRAT